MVVQKKMVSGKSEFDIFILSKYLNFETCWYSFPQCRICLGNRRELEFLDKGASLNVKEEVLWQLASYPALKEKRAHAEDLEKPTPQREQTPAMPLLEEWVVLPDRGEPTTNVSLGGAIPLPPESPPKFCATDGKQPAPTAAEQKPAAKPGICFDQSRVKPLKKLQRRKPVPAADTSDKLVGSTAHTIDISQGQSDDDAPEAVACAHEECAHPQADSNTSDTKDQEAV